MHRVSHYLRASQHSVLYHIQAAAEARAQLVSAPYEQRRAFLAALREAIAQDEFHIERANRHDCEAFAMQKQRISVTAAPYLPYNSNHTYHHHQRTHKGSKEHKHTSTTSSTTAQQTTNKGDTTISTNTHYEGNSKDVMDIQPRTISSSYSSSSTTLISSHTRYAPSALSPLRLDKLYRSIDAIAALRDPIAPPSSAAWLMHDKIDSNKSEWSEEQTTRQPQANPLSSSSSSTPVQAEVVEVSVPMGLVAILSRYRPRMCVDAVAMGILAGNALLLDGGAALSDTNTALMHCVRNALRHVGLPLTAVSYVEGNERGDDLTSHSHSTLSSTTTMNEYSEAIGDDAMWAQKAHKRLAQPDFTHHLSRSSTATLQWLKQKNSPIDCVLICGPGRLFDFARRHSTLPIIRATAQGASLYIDVSASYEMALEIVLNAKLQRCGAANAVTTLLVHKKFIRATELLAALNHYAIELHAEAGTIELCAQLDTNHNIRFIVAEEEDYRDESLIAQHPRALCVKFVASVDEALHFLDLFGARQVDGIVACDANVIARFAREVDTAVVVINSSTRLCSGQALQRGWDLALSTSKLHCRGPVSMGVFTTRKLLVRSPDLHTPILRK